MEQLQVLLRESIKRQNQQDNDTIAYWDQQFGVNERSERKRKRKEKKQNREKFERLRENWLLYNQRLNNLNQEYGDVDISKPEYKTVVWDIIYYTNELNSITRTLDKYDAWEDINPPHRVQLVEHTQRRSKSKFLSWFRK